jgi:hypothetical protein
MTDQQFEIIEETDMVVYNKLKRTLEIISLEFTDTYYNAKSLINTLKEQEFLKEEEEEEEKHEDVYIFPLKTSLMHCLAFNGQGIELQNYIKSFHSAMIMDFMN